MKAKELIAKLQELDGDRDMPVFFCEGSIYNEGLQNIGEVVSDPPHFIMLKKAGKFGIN